MTKTTHDYRWEFIPRQDGKPGKRMRQVAGGEYCPVTFCELCGRCGSVSRIYPRHDCYGWEYPLNNRGWRDFDYSERFDPKYQLCMACWNKVRVFVRRDEELWELRRLIRELEKAIADERKAVRALDGRTSRTAVRHGDGGA